MDLAEPFIPDNVKFRNLLFQFEKLQKGFVDVGSFRKLDPIGQYRLQNGKTAFCLFTQALSGKSLA